MAPCRAEDYQPFDAVPAPADTRVVLGYYEFGTRNEYNSTITGTAKDNTNLDSHIGIARVLYYTEVAGLPFLFDEFVPFGTLTNGRINGHRLNTASGVGDPIVSEGIWFINQPENRRWLSATSYLTVPVGTYDRGQALNLGGNRWQHDLQVDFIQGILDKFTIDVAGDWIYYWNNTEAGNGHQTLSQTSTYSAYAWLCYDVAPPMRELLPHSTRASIAIGYAGNFGGAQQLEGIPTGVKTREQQIRLSYLQSITPTWGVVLSLSHDTAVSGQFKENFGSFLRVSKAF